MLVAPMLSSKLSITYFLLRRLFVVGKDGTFNFVTDAVIIVITLRLIAFIPWPLHIPFVGLRLGMGWGSSSDHYITCANPPSLWELGMAPSDLHPGRPHFCTAFPNGSYSISGDSIEYVGINMAIMDGILRKGHCPRPQTRDSNTIDTHSWGKPVNELVQKSSTGVPVPIHPPQVVCAATSPHRSCLPETRGCNLAKDFLGTKPAVYVVLDR